MDLMGGIGQKQGEGGAEWEVGFAEIWAFTKFAKFILARERERERVAMSIKLTIMMGLI